MEEFEEIRKFYHSIYESKKSIEEGVASIKEYDIDDKYGKKIAKQYQKQLRTIGKCAAIVKLKPWFWKNKALELRRESYDISQNITHLVGLRGLDLKTKSLRR